MTDEAIILAGGFGFRLQPVVNDVPKSMAPVAGRPFLEYQLDYLKTQGIRHVIFSLGYLSEVIIQYFGSNYNGIKLSFAVENEPLGTGGGIMLAMQRSTREQVFVLNGDSLFLVPFDKMSDYHNENSADITLALRKVENANRYGTVEVDEQSRIRHFMEKSGEIQPGLINGGIYLINKPFFQSFEMTGKFSIEKQFFPQACIQHQVFGFSADAYFIDIGIPQDYERAQHEFKKLAY
ncbi:MAG: D-glycero-D-manno-heptose 1-phosphate guanosyltransferase [Bacteroidetes bacterium]|nr:D-glycero-D-manno-heptose 1-phosphate guanosyltransferase [Bacteroidota bacterium]